ncbi:MAG: hypothetical protein WAN65_11890 [Candidatus Sulfotelmatobacter sp.]
MLRNFMLGLALVALAVPAAQAKEKVSVSCFYESGQNQTQKISDYTIVNMHGPKIPKGTVIHFTLNAAPGKEYTATAPKDMDVMDDFSTGGNYPPDGCTAWWMK